MSSGTTDSGGPGKSRRPETKSPPDDLFAESWQRHGFELFQRCLFWMGGRRDDAEEAYSRASLRIFQKFPSHYRSLHDVRAWMLRLAYHACMDVHRENRRRREERLEADSPAGTSADDRNPERSALGKELRSFLVLSIDSLPRRLRDTVRWHLSSTSYREVADRLAITEVNVRKRMQEARSMLRRRLSAYHAGRTGLPRGAEEAAAEHRPAHGRWRVHGLRAVELRLPSGAETESVLYLGYRPKRTSRARREALERYVAKHPGGWKKQWELGRHLLELGRAEEAVESLEQVARREPRQLTPWLDLAAAYRLLERSEAEAEAYARARRVVPDAAERRFLDGLLAWCRGEPATAESHLEACCEAAPGEPGPWTALAEQQIARGRPAQAVAALAAALEADPDDAAALSLGYEELRLAGRSGEARRRAAWALEADAANPLALCRFLRDAFRAGGGLASAKEPRAQLARLRRLAASRADARSCLAYREVCRGRLAAAEELLADLVRQRPRLRQAWLELSRFLDAVGEPLRAAEALAEARALSPPHRRLDLLACRIAARAGRAERALVDRLLDRYGDAWDVASTAAWALSRVDGEEALALALSRTAVSRQPALPAAWIEHGRVLARLGLRTDAAAALESGLRLTDEDGPDLVAAAALDLAEVHLGLGSPGEARGWARRALAAARALLEPDPARAACFHRRALGLAPALEAAPLPELPTRVLLDLEERRILTFQLSEPSWI